MPMIGTSERAGQVRTSLSHCSALWLFWPQQGAREEDGDGVNVGVDRPTALWTQLKLDADFTESSAVKAGGNLPRKE